MSSGSEPAAPPGGPVIYFDNAATSWPKPRCVLEAMEDYLRDVGANPGRSGHSLSAEAGILVNDARENVAALLGLEDPLRVVFGHNATDALNLAIRGLLRKGDHAVTGSMEHNSVMRPLRDMEALGVEVTVVECDVRGFPDPEDFASAMKGNTRLMVVNHASNVNGSIAPVRELGALARERGIPFLVDGAQSAGCVPVDLGRDNIDLFAFTGHKSLLGPQGTGGLAIADDFDESRIRRSRSGGTGSRSESEEHPDTLPDLFESGTLNAVGLAGLAAGVGYVLDRTVETVREVETALIRRFLDGASGVEGLKAYNDPDPKRQTPTFSINLEGLSPSDVALALDDGHRIMCRSGLHCAPRAHRTLGTFPGGTVRFGLGHFNTSDEMKVALEALEEVVRDG